MITLENVTKSFTDGDSLIEALKSTSFTAQPGELTAIIGPSGSGKSTLLTVMGGLQKPTAGTVELAGVRMDQASEKERARARFSTLGFILQASSLVPFLRVKEQLILHAKVAGDSPDLQRREEIMEDLGITKLADKYPGEISGGERQRVAIGAALMHNPQVILADEPTASLDTDRALEIVKLLADLTHAKHKTTVMVTHDQRLLEYCDRVWEMRDGVLTQQR